MNPEQERLKQILAEAVAKPSAAERAAYLEVACLGDAALRRRVERLLLAHERAGSFLDQTVVLGEDKLLGEGPGTIIGRYKLLERIGEGGFGVVFMAEQTEPVNRKVALKVVKVGMDTREVIARFEAERQALALMDHPNIAKVLDAGATETGRPYFVMELVRGIPITDYCDQCRLPTEQRLRLLMKVCQGVQHAHQKGIIHRDLKPTNILVTLIDGEAVPKIIDFGIAKALGQKLTERTLFTSFQQMIGTPAYMSPEQAALSGVDVDTRSDIYSLGVLLYQLLTGGPPLDAETLRRAGLDEVRRMIQETEPLRPSTRLRTLGEKLTEVAKQRQTEPSALPRLVNGDLDWIVMKALEKDRARRYETASALLEDLQHHLDHEPVKAVPPGAAYRAGKFIRRHRTGVTLAASVAIVLVIGLVVCLLAFTQARRERDRARDAEQRAETNEQKARSEAARSAQVAQFMKDMLRGVGPGVALGRDTKLLREILDQTAERVGRDLKDQPKVAAELRETLGIIYRDIGLYTNAQVMLEEALRLRKSLPGSEHLSVASALANLAEVFRQQRRNAEAETAYREVLAIRRRLLGNEHADVAASLFGLAEILRRKETPPALAEAEAFHREALAMRRKLLGADHPDVASSLTGLGIVLGKEGQKKVEAEACFRESVDIQRKQLGNQHPDLAYTLCNLGWNVGGHEGETAIREALAIQKKVLGDHRDTAYSLNFLGMVLMRQGKLSDAEQMYREALAMQRKVLGEHTDEGISLSWLGQTLRQQGRLAEAEAAFREALALRRKLLGDEHPFTMGSLSELTDVLRRRGKLAEAEAIDRKAVNAQGLNDLAWQLATDSDPKLRDGPSAVSLAEKAVAESKRQNPWFLSTLAAAYAEVGQFTNAANVQQEAIPLLKDEQQKADFVAGVKLFAAGIPYHDPGSLAKRAMDLLAQDKFAEAEPVTRECLALRERLAPDDWRTFNARSMLGGSLLGQKKYAEAEPLLLSGYQGMRERADKIPTVGKLRLKEALQRLAQLYEDTGRTDQAAQWKQELAESEKAETETKPATPPR